MHYHNIFFSFRKWDPWDRLNPSIGIRQGDPLSSYIFILCAEILARKLQSASRMGDKLVGVTLGHSHVKIPFLIIVDDTMIFSKASSESCIVIKNILNTDCSMSGQLVNYNKSTFWCSTNTNSSLLEEFASIPQMEESLFLEK